LSFVQGSNSQTFCLPKRYAGTTNSPEIKTDDRKKNFLPSATILPKKKLHRVVKKGAKIEKENPSNSTLNDANKKEQLTMPVADLTDIVKKRRIII